MLIANTMIGVQGDVVLILLGDSLEIDDVFDQRHGAAPQLPSC
eukprot:gene17644-8458_t